mgnify:CR=1 FL=1
MRDTHCRFRGVTSNQTVGVECRTSSEDKNVRVILFSGSKIGTVRVSQKMTLSNPWFS